MRTQLCPSAAGCFAVLRRIGRIRSIRRSITQPVLQSLVVALVLSRLDYGSTVLFSLPQQLIDRLQSAYTKRRGTTGACRPSSRPHQSTAAGFSLAVGRWMNYISVSGTYLPLFPRLSVETTAASLWRLHASVTPLLVVHCTRHFADRSSYNRWQSFLCCRDVRLERLDWSSSSASLSLFRKLLKTKLFKRS